MSSRVPFIYRDTDNKIAILARDYPGDATGEVYANIAAVVLNTDVASLYWADKITVGPTGKTDTTQRLFRTRKEMIAAYPSSEFNDQDSAIASDGWSKSRLTNPDMDVQNYAKRVLNNPPPDDPPRPIVEPPDVGSTITETGFDLPNGKGQGIFCFVRIGGTVVGDGTGLMLGGVNDVISMRAEINSSIEGGSPSATCDIVLHNNHQKYGHIIASGEWKPNITTVFAIVYNYKNMVYGQQTYLIRKGYVFFYGVLSQASFDSTTCTVKCTSFDGLLQQAHFEEYVVQPWQKPPEVVQAVVKPIEKSGMPPVIVNAMGDTWNEVKLKINISGTQSSIANAAVVSNEYGFWIYTDAQSDGTYPLVLLLNDYYVSGYMLLDPYVTKQGYTMSSLGHANKIDLAVNSEVDPLDTRHDIPSHQNKPNRITLTNPESIAKYGEILYTEGKVGSAAGGITNARNKALNTQIKLDAKIDNRIEATVVGMIPKMWSLVTYTISDGTAEGLDDIVITAKVAKETIDYSARGLITQLVMARLRDSGAIEASDAPPDPQEPEKTPTFSQKYETAVMVGNEDLYTWFQGKKDVDGTISYMGMTSDGISTGWVNLDGIQDIIPADVLTAINGDLA